VIQAIPLIKWYPGEIESDLSRYHRLDVADWHRGVVSSRKLLTLLEHLPEEAAYKRALRDGGYTQAEWMAAETHNEIARLRASYHAVNGGDDAVFEPFEFLDPRVSKLRAQQEIDELEDHERAEHELYAEIGWE
jgi:hypothetical protein